MAHERLKRNVALLNVLSQASKRQREAILNTATRDQINCICDCCNNILRENIPLTPLDFNNLKRYQSIIRYLARDKNPRKYKQKKQFLVQEGGFLPVLLAPILGVVGSILAETLIKKP